MDKVTIVGHGRIECSECGKVLVSCRCIDCGKNVNKIVCDECKGRSSMDRIDILASQIHKDNGAHFTVATERAIAAALRQERVKVIEEMLELHGEFTDDEEDYCTQCAAYIYKRLLKAEAESRSLALDAASRGGEK